MSTLKYIPLLLLFIVISAMKSTPPQEDPLAKCLEKSSSSWGAPCGQCVNSTKSYRINLKNICKDVLDVKVAVQERTMRWKTFNMNKVAPGDTVTAYACEGTGKYVFWTKKTGDNTIEFPNDADIETQFNPKAK